MSRPIDMSKVYFSTDEELQEMLEEYKQELEEETFAYELACEEYDNAKENVCFIEEEIAQREVENV